MNYPPERLVPIEAETLYWVDEKENVYVLTDGDLPKGWRRRAVLMGALDRALDAAQTAEREDREGR